MKSKIDLLDVVALTDERPDDGLSRGQVGTVVEILGPGIFEVEFADDRGQTYAELAVPGEQLLVLHYEPTSAT